MKKINFKIVPRVLGTLLTFLSFSCSDMLSHYASKHLGPCLPHTVRDGGLALDSNDPLDACKAIGLNEKDIVSTRWVLPDGSEPPAANFHIGHALFSSFGDNVRVQEGSRCLALSTGNAQLAAAAGYSPNLGFDKLYSHPLPPGFPAQSTTCAPQTYQKAHDGIALEIVLRVPSDAKGFLFDFKFYTSEYPDWICSIFPDHFIVLVSPAPKGSINSNICFTAEGPICVNSSLISVCKNCTDGDAELAGTGFENYGATVWLETIAPVHEKSTITVQFTIWDNSDGIYDSIVLIDNWRWVTFKVDGAHTYVKDTLCPCESK